MYVYVAWQAHEGPQPQAAPFGSRLL